MKTKQWILAITIACSCHTFAQDKWDTDGNNSLPTNNKFGSKNNRDVNIFTNNTKRGEFTKDGKFNFYGPIKADTLRSDTLVVNGGARIKGRLHVGSNSLWLGNTVPGATDDITSTNGNIGLGGEAPLPFSQIKVGLGTQSPNYNFHIADNRLPSGLVRQQFTNSSTTSAPGRGFLLGILPNGNANLHQQENGKPLTLTTNNGFTGVNSNFVIGTTFVPTSLFHVNDGTNQTDMQVTNNATGVTANDGFKFGITNTGIAQLNQQENLPMTFFTGNTTGLSTERVRIMNATGRVGINTTNPNNRLEVTSASGDVGFGSTNGSSGIRLTNLTSASTPLVNPTTGVLSVNATGDIIFVKDNTGTGGGGTSPAQNGLNTTTAPGFIEMGGPLLHNTTVSLQNYNMMWGGLGTFNISSTGAVPANPYNPKTTLYNTELSTGHYNLTDLTVSPPGVTGTYGAVINNFTKNGFGNTGISVDANGSGDGTVGLGAHAKSTSSTASGNNYVIGVIGSADDGAYNYGGQFVAVGKPGLTNQTYGVGGFTGGTAAELNGVFGSAAGTAPMKRGVYGIVNAAISNEAGYGLYGIASTGNSSTILSNTNVYGVYGRSAFAVNNYGVYGTINSGIGTNAYAIYGDISGSATTGYGVTYAGYFNGNVRVNGTITGATAISSDNKFKTNKQAITNSKTLINALLPKSFNYDTTSWQEFRFSGKKQYGLIAQDVESVMPELVTNMQAAAITDSTGNVIKAAHSFKAVNYNALIAVLLANAKEQNTRIDSLINASQPSGARMGNPAQNSPPTTTNSTSLNKQSVTLADADALVLDQNQPNPFSESTVIKYNLPAQYGYAQLIFTTAEGRILKTIDITKKGPGEITVYANDLSNGIYSYALVVDGKTVDTKKMIKQN